MANKDGYVQFRCNHADKTTQTTFVATGATGVTLVSPRNATQCLNIQRIRLDPTTYAAGSLTFTATDATGTLVSLLTQPTAAPTALGGEISVFQDFGPKGFLMASGATLFMTRSATGSAGALMIEAYETPSTPLAIANTN